MNNITELNNLIYVGAKQVSEKITISPWDQHWNANAGWQMKLNS